MKLNWKTTLVAAATAALFVPALALAAPTERVEANVPFSFVAGHETLPAGSYVFSLNDPMESSMLTIESKNGKRVDVLLTTAVARDEPVNHSKLVFDEYGNDHFLSQVWVSGSDEARVLPKSEVQREYAKLLRQREVNAHAVTH